MASRRKKIVAAMTGGLVALGTGAAVAAVLLSTNVTGQASVIHSDDGVRNAVSVVASSEDGSRLDCSDVAVSNDFKTLTFNPVLTIPSNGDNVTGAPVPGGECKVNVTVKNTGTERITISPDSRIDRFPTGWDVRDLRGTGSAIAPGEEATLSATVVATDGAKAGQISGQLVYTAG